MPCVHYISPDSLKDDKPTLNNDIIIQPKEDGSIVFYFNGPGSLMDVTISSNNGDKFTLELSQDGKDFSPYTDSDENVVV